MKDRLEENQSDNTVFKAINLDDYPLSKRSEKELEQEQRVEVNANEIFNAFENNMCFAEIEQTLLRAIELAKYRCYKIDEACKIERLNPNDYNLTRFSGSSSEANELGYQMIDLGSKNTKKP